MEIIVEKTEKSLFIEEGEDLLFALLWSEVALIKLINANTLVRILVRYIKSGLTLFIQFPFLKI